MLRVAGGDAGPATLEMLREVPANGGIPAPLERLMQKLVLPPDATRRFVEDYVDTFSAIATYEAAWQALRPPVEGLIETIRALAQEPHVRSDKLLLVALSEVVQSLPELMSSAGKRLAAVEKVAGAMWATGSGVALRSQQKQIREFQVLLGFILCGVAAKISGWQHAFPPNAQGNASKRAAFIGTEMNHSLQELRDAALKGTRATSFPDEVLRLHEKGRGDSFRATLRGLG
jgi:hypothetical protein